MSESSLPACVSRLLWEVDPGAVDLRKHRDFVLERVMTRSSWEAMQWLRRTYSREELAEFLKQKGDRLSPRDRAYWALIAGTSAPAEPGGGRPRWAR